MPRASRIIMSVVATVVASAISIQPAAAVAGCAHVLLVGHRGEIAYDRTENTYRSLDYAAAHGADGIEFDIRLTKDRKWVLMHDSKVNRTTNGTGYVSRLYASRITDVFRTNDSRAVGTPLHAPSLNSIVVGMPDQQGLPSNHPTLHYQVEFKPSTRAAVDDVRGAIALLTAAIPEQQIVATSTSFSMLAKIKAAWPSLTRAYISMQSPVPQSVLASLQQNGIQFANVGYNSISSAFVDAAHGMGLSVSVRGPKTPAQWQYALSLGPDNIVVDAPSAYKQWCASNPPSALRTTGLPAGVSPDTVQPD